MKIIIDVVQLINMRFTGPAPVIKTHITSEEWSIIKSHIDTGTTLLDCKEAVKVRFLSQIYEDDFPERGMKAWFTGVTKHEKFECYELFFDFTEFEEENLKYFTETFYPNMHTDGTKDFYTAIEAGYYKPKYSVFFGDTAVSKKENESMLAQCIEVIE